MPLDELMALLQTTTTSLVSQHQEVALDQAAYHRRYWSHWQKLPEGLSIAAMTRECEMHCKEMDEAVRLSEQIREGLIAKRDALVAILAARSA